MKAAGADPDPDPLLCPQSIFFMMNFFSQLRGWRRPWRDRLSHQLTIFLVDRLPRGFERILYWLNQGQLLLLLLCLIWITVPMVVVRPTIWQQTIVGIALVVFGTIIMRLEERVDSQRSGQRYSEYLHLLLMSLSLIVTLRYLYYRTQYTLNFDSWIDGLFSLLLYLAELYAIATLVLSYFQTIKTTNRKPVDISEVPIDQLPSVDVYIPTYNEDVEIVRKTSLGALALDYPLSKKQVYILDDGRRDLERRAQLAVMCEELGCILLTRDNNEHAKAGNINTALHKTAGDLVMILDCDHIPVRTFLTETVGFFVNDRVALVQTPHWFYNPDPFERNLLTGGRIPVGNELFYKVLQRGNDYWNAAFFCGSAAIIRRDRLLEVGGIATETVTEDCHTSLRLHAKGYQTVYYDKIMVAGLAPEKFSSYVGQQVRWARGMAQILRIENPLFNRKLHLNLPQRICYFSATSHFFFGFPRLMYAIAPALFLLFGINSVKGLGVETLVYALPHILLSMQTNHIPYKHVRFSFWNEIYEFAMSFQAGIVTLLALINPRMGQFNVTSKGLVVDKRSFDLDSVRYLVMLGTVTGASLLTVPFWLIISPKDMQAVLINALWCGFNLLLVVAACLVAFEQPQLRRAHRMPRQIPVVLHSEGQSWYGQTINISETGAKIELDTWPNIPDQVRIELVGDLGARALLDAQIVRAIATDTLQTQLIVDFMNVSRVQLDDLTLVLYSDVQEWYAQHRQESDNPLESLRFISTSLKRAFNEFRPEFGVKVRKQVRGTAQLFWEKWDGYFYTAKITEMGSRDMRLEFSGNPILNLDALKLERPVIAVSIQMEDSNAQAQSLLAQVEEVEVLAVFPGDSPYHRVALELSFPDDLKSQQQRKIKRVLRQLQT